MLNHQDPGGFGHLLPKCLRDLCLRLYILPQLFAVPVLEQAVAAVLTGSRCLVQVRDGLLCRQTRLVLLGLVVERDAGVTDAGVGAAVFTVGTVA